MAAVGVLLAGSAFAQRFAQPQDLAFCEAGDQTVAYTGGRWFTGNGFQSRDVFVTHGQISLQRPAQVDRVIDIHDMYVVPPYGEAHNHNIDYTTPEATAAIFAKYAREGVFYVLNPGSAPRGPKLFWRGSDCGEGQGSGTNPFFACPKSPVSHGL